MLIQPSTKVSVINSTFHLAEYERKSQLLINDENGRIYIPFKIFDTMHLSGYMFISLSFLAGLLVSFCYCTSVTHVEHKTKEFNLINLIVITFLEFEQWDLSKYIILHSITE